MLQATKEIWQGNQVGVLIVSLNGQGIVESVVIDVTCGSAVECASCWAALACLVCVWHASVSFLPIADVQAHYKQEPATLFINRWKVFKGHMID